MALLFSTYLRQHHINPQHLFDKETRIYHLHAWMRQLADAILKANTYYPSAYENLGRAFYQWVDSFFKLNWEDNLSEKIDQVDAIARYFYITTIDYAIAKSYKKPIGSALKKYPFNPNQPGVSMAVYIAQETKGDVSIHGGRIWEASDFLAHQSNGANLEAINQNILHAVNGKSLLSLESKQLIKGRVQTHRKHFHAEDEWFAIQLGNLIAYLAQFRDTLSGSTHDDEIWIQQLKATTRIEFVMTSTPCTDCLNLFKDMRQILNQMGMILPIVIFSNSATNTAETAYSQIAIIGFNGEYFNTELVGDMPYTKKRLCNPDFVRMRSFFNHETQIFNRLESVVNKVMCLMIFLPLSPTDRNKFVDDLFYFFDCCHARNQHVLPWFVYFLERLPKNFYTSKKIDRCYLIESMEESGTNVYRVESENLPKTRVETFLNHIKNNKVDFLPSRSPGRSRAPESLESITRSFELLIEPYLLNKGIKLFFNSTNRGIFGLSHQNEESSTPAPI